jgi:hypothetical protein
MDTTGGFVSGDVSFGGDGSFMGQTSASYPQGLLCHAYIFPNGAVWLETKDGKGVSSAAQIDLGSYPDFKPDRIRVNAYDWNKDGNSDYLVTLRYENFGTAPHNEGVVCFYIDGSDFAAVANKNVKATPRAILKTEPRTFAGENSNEYGLFDTTLGDVDGDGMKDFVVSYSAQFSQFSPPFTPAVLTVIVNGHFREGNTVAVGHDSIDTNLRTPLAESGGVGDREVLHPVAVDVRQSRVEEAVFVGVFTGEGTRLGFQYRP